MNQVVYAGEPFPKTQGKSVFLVGPTPRASNPVPSWRPEGLKEAFAAGFDTVFIPEPRDEVWFTTYDQQNVWETEGLERADVICAWVPRDMESMPALTTNVEIGMWIHSGKIVVAAPPNAPSVRYLFKTAERFGAPTAFSLHDALVTASDLAGDASLRSGALCRIPLMIWRTDTFQEWYKGLITAGNELVGADVLWSFRAREKVFSWALRPQVKIASEGRVKSNEFILARPDVVSVAAMTAEADPYVVLVREFRSAVNNPSGMVLELPGGSSFETKDLALVAAQELREETGLDFPAREFRLVSSRQVASTILTHRAHLYSLTLPQESLTKLSKLDSFLGDLSEDERTKVVLMRSSEALIHPDLDWTNRGLLSEALARRGIS